MKKKLSVQERHFAKEYVSNGQNATQAVKKIFGTKNHSYAKVKAHRLITNDNLQKEVERIKISIADKIPDDLLIEKHLELLNKRSKNGIDVYAVKHGLELAYKIKGSFAPQKIKQSGSLFGDLAHLSNEELTNLIAGGA
jgi:hypothetical protein